ncbi:MAG: prepilin peptidase [Kiritimatiellae bacterium]|nr:prepilin peptidase [Kiritimatiellia bacterium]
MEHSFSTFRAVIVLLLLPWLTILCVKDLRTRRLPNVWTLGGLACALVLDFVQGGGVGLMDGLAAAGVCILFLLIPFFVRAAGGGDVKMLAACGAFVGMKQVLLLLIAVSFAGFFVALAMLITGKVGVARMKHAFRTLFDWRYDRAAGRAALPPKEDEGNRIPFGLAIAIGTLATFAMEVFG